eukprot:156159_1
MSTKVTKRGGKRPNFLAQSITSLPFVISYLQMAYYNYNTQALCWPMILDAYYLGIETVMMFHAKTWKIQAFIWFLMHLPLSFSLIFFGNGFDHFPFERKDRVCTLGYYLCCYFATIFMGLIDQFIVFEHRSPNNVARIIRYHTSFAGAYAAIFAGAFGLFTKQQPVDWLTFLYIGDETTPNMYTLWMVGILIAMYFTWARLPHPVQQHQYMVIIYAILMLVVIPQSVRQWSVGLDISTLAVLMIITFFGPFIHALYWTQSNESFCTHCVLGNGVVRTFVDMITFRHLAYTYKWMDTIIHRIEIAYIISSVTRIVPIESQHHPMAIHFILSIILIGVVVSFDDYCNVMHKSGLKQVGRLCVMVASACIVWFISQNLLIIPLVSALCMSLLITQLRYLALPGLWSLVEGLLWIVYFNTLNDVSFVELMGNMAFLIWFISVLIKCASTAVVLGCREDTLQATTTSLKLSLLLQFLSVTLLYLCCHEMNGYLCFGVLSMLLNGVCLATNTGVSEYLHLRYLLVFCLLFC